MEHTSPDCQCEGKKCTKCEEVLCKGFYPKEKLGKDGLRASCKTCEHKRHKEWVTKRRHTQDIQATFYVPQGSGKNIKHTTQNCQCGGKVCSKCETAYCVGHYTKDWRLRTGLKSQCCTCQNKRFHEWRTSNDGITYYENSRTRRL